MKRRAVLLFAEALLVLGFAAITASSADDDEKKEGQRAVLKLVDSRQAKKGDVKAQAEAIHKKFDTLEPLMWIYKPRNRGGIGMGKNGEDDIEQAINKVGNARAKGMTPKKRLDMKRDLARAAEFSRVMAELTELYANQYKDDNGKKNPAKWKAFTQKMREGADELSKAAKGDDPVGIQKAAANLSNSCTECHGVFRQ